MAPLHEKRVNFNSKMVVNHTGGNLSTRIRNRHFKESMNCFIDDIHKEQILLNQQKIANSTTQVASAAQASPIFNATTARNTRKFK